MGKGIRIMFCLLALTTVIVVVVYVIGNNANTKIPSAVVEKRRKICNGCEHKKLDGKLAFCGLCGCNIKGKTSQPGQECAAPEVKWNKYITD